MKGCYCSLHRAYLSNPNGNLGNVKIGVWQQVKQDAQGIQATCICKAAQTSEQGIIPDSFNDHLQFKCVYQSSYNNSEQSTLKKLNHCVILCHLCVLLRRPAAHSIRRFLKCSYHESDLPNVFYVMLLWIANRHFIQDTASCTANVPAFYAFHTFIQGLVISPAIFSPDLQLSISSLDYCGIFILRADISERDKQKLAEWSKPSMQKFLKFQIFILCLIENICPLLIYKHSEKLSFKLVSPDWLITGRVEIQEHSAFLFDILKSLFGLYESPINLSIFIVSGKEIFDASVAAERTKNLKEPRIRIRTRKCSYLVKIVLKKSKGIRSVNEMSISATVKRFPNSNNSCNFFEKNIWNFRNSKFF
ncbi:hypothetical protein EGR_04896 [Echinococcus granulosus]|uniref:Uncharacterized protein n=1 Tax=Echinococcus granulosus TaxID=6210 RepID=W6UGR1_ECHGR|nr:hypothetical protein EGR_04896 [Echinococcus granulosus]EUB60186.1 hypothetical protein EGR_04896 [Echinococcus granulosus]